MILKGFDGADYLLEQILEAGDDPRKLQELVARVRQLVLTDDLLRLSMPGLPLCWKCTVKHVGQALGFAAELDRYPARIICVVGELGHAYRECPDKKLSNKIHKVYQRILETGCVADMTDLIQAVYKGWMAYLQDAK